MVSTNYLTKSRFIDGLHCSKSLWLSTHKYQAGTYEQNFAGHMGDQVGQLATAKYPEGKKVEAPYNDHDEAVEETQQYLSDKKISAIFEAAFTFDNIKIRVDILEREQDQWNLIEVKSATNLKDHYLFDIGIQHYVIQNLGLKINSSKLMHINKDYLYQEEIDLNLLFRFHDYSEEIQSILPTLPIELERLCSAQELKEEPHQQPSKSFCGDCAFWDYCTQNKPEDWIALIPRLHKNKYAKLMEIGIESMSAIPDDFEISENQRVVVESTKNKKRFLDKDGLQQALESIKPPVYYFDFEALTSAIPFIDNTRPFESIPFQWSLHLNKDFKDISHHYFLAEEKKDFRRDLIEQYLSLVGDNDYPIVAYNISYEKTRLKELSQLYPDLSAQIDCTIDRFVDLMLIIKDHFYDYRFYGSFSLKRVLPVLTNESGYDELKGVQDGDGAQAQFYDLINNSLNKEDRIKVKKQLLEYCEKDTYSLVQIHQKLISLLN